MLKNLLLFLCLMTLLSACGGSSSGAGDQSSLNTGEDDEVSALTLVDAFDVNATYVNEIYVNGAAASNGDGSQSLPFDNIPDGINAARNAGGGSRLHILPGTYSSIPLQANVQGQLNAPIAIVAEGSVIIDAGGSGVGMSLQNARYLVVEGLTIQNTGIHGLNIDDGGDYATPSEFIVLRDMHFRNIGSGGNNDCLKMSGVDNFHIETSEFEGCNLGEAIDMVGCHNGVITANYFHDVIRNGVQTKGGSSDILIHGNRFSDIPVRALNAGGSTAAQYIRPQSASYEAQNITMIANLFERTGNAVLVYAGCNQCVFANNTIIEPDGYVFWAVEENDTKGPGQYGYFLNNIVVFNDADLSDYSFFNTDGESLNNTFLIDGNLWYAQDNSGFSSLPNGSGFPVGGNDIFQQDPLLDASYRIGAGSPAIAQGVTVPGGVAGDYDAEMYLVPPSVGAFNAP